jgi:hypothetical protein
MEFKERLLKYTYTYYVQGSEEKGVEYALIHAPENATFNNVRSTLMLKRHKENYHEIDIESVEDLTIKW